MSFRLAELPSHFLVGPLPSAMLPTVCWLYRLVEGGIRLDPDTA